MPRAVKQNTGGVLTSDPGLMGDRIKLARSKARLTQAALARKLGITAAAVGQWEIHRNGPETDKVRLLAEILNVSVDWLLGKQRPSEQPHERTPATADDHRRSIEDARRLGEEAHLLGVDLKQLVAEARQRRWIDENRGALEDANAFLTKYGLWSEGRRLF